MRTVFLVAAALALALPAAARAQNDGPPDAGVLAGDYLTLGAGGFYGPSYDGSDDYVLSPAPLIQGRLLGVAITPRPAGIALDLIPDAKDAKVGFSLGPVVTVNRNRVSKIKDPVVRALGKLDTAVELGGNAGVTVYDLLTGYDSVTLSADVKWDVAGAHKGMTLSPSISYFTPLSKGMVVNLALSAERMDDDYADYYFSVSPAQALASGLPTFAADGGWKSLGVSVLTGIDLDGDATNGGFAAFAIGGYSRMLGGARRTPLTSVRGSRDQWTIGVGLGFTF